MISLPNVHLLYHHIGNINTLNFLNGSRGPGVIGSGYSARPSSAGATRHHSSKHRHHSTGEGNSGSGFSTRVTAPAAAPSGGSSQSRPKSASSTSSYFLSVCLTRSILTLVFPLLSLRSFIHLHLERCTSIIAWAYRRALGLPYIQRGGAYPPS